LVFIGKLSNEPKFQEEATTVNLTKYRQLQNKLEDAVERADVAENSLAKMRVRSGNLTVQF
jgi:hypothetical protein